MFAQQSLQPKLSRRRYASVSCALQNNTEVNTEVKGFVPARHRCAVTLEKLFTLCASVTKQYNYSTGLSMNNNW